MKLGKSLELEANQNRVGGTFSNGKKRETNFRVSRNTL